MPRHRPTPSCQTSTTAREGPSTWLAEPEDVRKRYGLNRFGRGSVLARRLVERGVRFVTVKLETVFNEITWDSRFGALFAVVVTAIGFARCLTTRTVPYSRI